MQSARSNLWFGPIYFAKIEGFLEIRKAKLNNNAKRCFSLGAN